MTDKPNMLQRGKIAADCAEAVAEIAIQLGERNTLKARVAKLEALLDRAAHIVTGCAALLCERGCQDETDLDAFAAEIRKALEEKP